ncbi:MAG: DUF4369 domain-containing protein [Bacteroidaceae bacterium]|nr:DUF4369 domain-containing protein [Bacteroidaceae bacterium]
MKPTKLFLALAVAVLLGACAKQERCYTLTGELPDSSYNDMTVYLADFDNASKIDSATVIGNMVTFRGITPDTALNCRIDIARSLFSNPILEKGNIATSVTFRAFLRLIDETMNKIKQNENKCFEPSIIVNNHLVDRMLSDWNSDFSNQDRT